MKCYFHASYYHSSQALDNNNNPIGKKTGALKGFSENREFLADIKVKDDSLTITDCDGNKKTITNKGLDKSSTVGDFKNKFVKINEFSMLIKEATGSSTALIGKGSIVVSWLKTPIAVKFSNISVDANMKVTKGDVFAVQDADASDLPKFLKATNTAAVTKAQVKSLNGKLKANKSKLVKDQNLDDKVKEMATDKTPTLPLGINDVLGYTIAISEMKFSPDKNTLLASGLYPTTKRWMVTMLLHLRRWMLFLMPVRLQNRVAKWFCWKILTSKTLPKAATASRLKQRKTTTYLPPIFNGVARVLKN
jgi:hypothetical protein